MAGNEQRVPSVHDVASMVPSDKRCVAESLASELDFMAHTLDELKAHVQRHGAVDLYRNGAQECWRESPALKSYNQMVQRYSNLARQLVALLPAGVVDDEDELDLWLKENG